MSSFSEIAQNCDIYIYDICILTVSIWVYITRLSNEPNSCPVSPGFELTTF